MKTQLQTPAGLVQPGTKIRIDSLQDPYRKDYNGREGVVELIDDIGQLHGTWGGFAVIPEEDTFTILN